MASSSSHISDAMTLLLETRHSCISVQTSHTLDDILHGKLATWPVRSIAFTPVFLRSWAMYFIDIVLSIDRQSAMLPRVVHLYNTAAPVPLSKNIELVSVNRYSTALLLGIVFRPNPVRPGPG